MEQKSAKQQQKPKSSKLSTATTPKLSADTGPKPPKIQTLDLRFDDVKPNEKRRDPLKTLNRLHQSVTQRPPVAALQKQKYQYHRHTPGYVSRLCRQQNLNNQSNDVEDEWKGGLSMPALSLRRSNESEKPHLGASYFQDNHGREPLEETKGQPEAMVCQNGHQVPTVASAALESRSEDEIIPNLRSGLLENADTENLPEASPDLLPGKSHIFTKRTSDSSEASPFTKRRKFNDFPT